MVKMFNLVFLQCCSRAGLSADVTSWRVGVMTSREGVMTSREGMMTSRDGIITPGL